MEQYKTSKYNFLENKEERCVLFNSKTGGVVVPDLKDTKKFLEVLNNPLKYKNNDEMKKQLIDYKLLVKKDINELDEIKEVHETGIKESKRSIGYVIVPTEYCNFACPYCFVYNYSRPPMSQNVYDGIYNSIIKQIEENQKEEQEWIEKAKKDGKNEKELKNIKISTVVGITWFGGEPTCAADKILEFMDRLLKLKEIYKNIHIDAGMITNGYLLTYDLLKKFVDKKITFFQLTLDGDKETHDKTRYLRESKGETFNIIYKNMLEISKKAPKDLNFRISVRSNFLKSNQESMEKLKEKFTKDFGKDKRFSNYFHQVYGSEKDTSSLDNDMYGEADGIDAACQLNNIYDNEILKNSHVSEMYNTLPRPKAHPCFSTNKNSYCVTVKGALFGCESMIGADEKAVGFLKKDGNIEYNKENYKRWKGSLFNNKKTFEKCLECNLLPVCIGGCRYNKFEKVMEGCFITDEVLQQKLQDYLKEYLRKEKTGEINEKKTINCCEK